LTRTLPSTLAPVVETLELDAPQVVTTTELRALITEAKIRTDPYVTIHRLAEHGWLLPTGVRGVWEFAPAAHGGPIGHADPFLVLRAQLAATPGLDVRLALESALWQHGIADRVPGRHVVAVPSKNDAPTALRRAYTLSWFRSRLPAARIGGLPIAAAETTLVQLAHAPSAVTNWGLILNCLADLVAVVDHDQVRDEAVARSNATLARLAYLTAPFSEALATSLAVEDQGTVWFGPRTQVRRTDARWNIADTILPRAPAEATG
jgi:predicted transcriptional regulator of viral defense system